MEVRMAVCSVAPHLQTVFAGFRPVWGPAPVQDPPWAPSREKPGELNINGLS